MRFLALTCLDSKDSASDSITNKLSWWSYSSSGSCQNKLHKHYDYDFIDCSNRPSWNDLVFHNEDNKGLSGNVTA